MKHFRILLFIFLTISISVNAQIVYPFETVHNPAGCQYSYDIDITLTLDSALVTDIYFDDNVSSGSFAFETLLSFDIVFSNSTLPPGDFFTFQPTLISENPNLNTPTLTNDLGTVPLTTSSSGGHVSFNRPTYNGSASAMGLELGKYYSATPTLAGLGYDHATLQINLPCLDTLIEADEDPMPVRWSELRATAIANDVTLRWQTVMEWSSSHYNIHRSLDAKEWILVGMLPSQAPNGESLQKLNYKYSISEDLPGTFYYKVVQTDFDGTETPSAIVSATVLSSNESSLVLYPNPVDQQIFLRQGLLNTTYEIYDINGRHVLGGTYDGKININRIRPGMYIIKMAGKTSRFLVK